MSSRKTVLIVDDNKVNRKILSKILLVNYKVIAAANGKEAIEILEKQEHNIVGIMLDLMMPVMSGYEFLDWFKTAGYTNIPVIVTTGNSDYEHETRALDLGAWDFVPKPYNAKVLLSRLRNAIARSEIAAFEQLRYMAEYDALTGLYNKMKFYDMTRKLLENKEVENAALIRLDIERFSLINSFYGTEKGDDLLIFLSNILRRFADSYEQITYGRMEGDLFAFCISNFDEQQMSGIEEYFKSKLAGFQLDFNLVITFGIYNIQDKNVPVRQMLDYANLAAKRIKGNYIENYSFYTQEMSETLENEQRIANEMNEALEQGQFKVYLQPKYSLHTDTPSGAEALVRWVHPKKGLISPGKFIPVFERNGFISRLDYYMWEQVCILLRKWMDEGLQPSPVSVNVSRVNLYNPKLIDILCELTDKYSVPRNLLNLELTESMYTENSEIIQKTLKDLHEKGFIVLMDDFGSGYSSLNILKDIDIDILKIDMGFFEKSEIPGRSENIVSSVVRMSKWLNIPTVAEGVERLEQVDFLRGIGCEFVQGYYFAKPMPVEEYEKLIEAGERFVPEKKENFDANSLWVNDSQTEILFSEMQQAVAIYEFIGNHIELLRVNKAFYNMFGYKDEVLGSRNALSVVLEEDRENVVKAFREAVDTEGIAEAEYRRQSNNSFMKWVRVTVKYINSVGDKNIMLCCLSDISEQKTLEKEIKRFHAALNVEKAMTNKILIVDDIEMNREILAGIFEGKYEVLQAENGEDALRVLEEQDNNVDIILLDLIMPVMDGKKFLERKKANPQLSDLPVVIISVDSSPEQQINTLSLGVEDYIVKPFVDEVVLRRVRNVLESHRRFNEAVRECSLMDEEERNDLMTGVYNRATAERMIVGNMRMEKGNMHALIVLDVDNMGKINDNYGNETGDHVLIEIAGMLKNYYRKGDIIARLGSDEFCVFMCAIPSETVAMEKCTTLCNMICQKKFDGNVHATISAGITVTSENRDTLNALYRGADKALYYSKSSGKNRVTLVGDTGNTVAMGKERSNGNE